MVSSPDRASFSLSADDAPGGGEGFARQAADRAAGSDQWKSFGADRAEVRVLLREHRRQERRHNLRHSDQAARKGTLSCRGLCARIWSVDPWRAVRAWRISRRERDRVLEL